MSPLANALAIPVVSLAVVPLALGGAALSLIGSFGWLLQLAQTVMSLCYTALTFLAELPGAVWQSHAPQE